MYERFFYVGDFSEGLAPVESGSDRVFECYYIDKTGKEVIRGGFSSASKFHEGMARIGKHGVIYFIDKTGNIITKKGYEEARDFQEGMALVKINDRYFYIDKSGQEINKEGFVGAESFKDGVALVGVIGGEKFYIDKKGNRVFS